MEINQLERALREKKARGADFVRIEIVTTAKPKKVLWVGEVHLRPLEKGTQRVFTREGKLCAEVRRELAQYQGGASTFGVTPI